ncbi:hypothetical protein ABZ894_02175 [Nocardia beijingensis]
MRVVCRDADALFRYTRERTGAPSGLDRREISPVRIRRTHRAARYT